MKNSINLHAETLKKSVNGVSKKSKESIKTLIETNSKQFNSAIETNSKTFDSISKMLSENELDPSIITDFKSSLAKSIKLSEDTIDTIIDSHTKRIDLSIDFTTKFMEIIQNENIGTKEGMDKLVGLVKDNFDKSTELTMGNMEKIVSVYNNNLNLALNFNKKFADNINSQITSRFKLQKKSFDSFFAMDMVTEWWKHDGKEKV